jgi:hypothetical protein
MVLRVSDAYLDEYSSRIHEKYKLEISGRVIGRFLSRKGITRKKVLYFCNMTDQLATKGGKRTLFITSTCLAQEIGEMASKSACIP